MKKQLVHIDWCDEDFDWNYFYVIGLTPRGLRLKGADDPDTGAKHKGDCFEAEWNEIFVLSPISDEVAA